MSERHEPWCDSRLGPNFEVHDGEIRMTIFACLGCKGEPIPSERKNAPPPQGGGDGAVALWH